MPPRRGPDFLPYPPPASAPLPPPVGRAPLPPPPPPASRPRGYDARVVVLAAAAAAVGGLLLVSWLAGYPRWGAGLAVLAASVALAVAPRALARRTGTRQVRLARVVAVTAAALAVLTVAAVALVPDETLIAKAPALPPDEESYPERRAAPPTSTAPRGLPTDVALVTGRVTYVDGTPLPGAVIRAARAQRGDTSSAPGCPLAATATTDARGYFTMQLCQLGPGLGWSLRAEHKGAQVQTIRFLSAGRPSTWEVRLPLEPPRKS